jgi:GAF domain-containing protein
VYLKRHWYEFETPDKQLVTVYFDRGAKPGGARWWLYAIVSREERARAIAAEIRAAGNYRWVGVYDVLSDTVSIIAYDGAAEPSYPVFPRDKGLTGQMLRAGQTLVVGDVTKNDAYLTAFGTTRSEIIVPVRVNGEIAGTLDVESERIDAFGDDDRAKLERAAEMLAPLYGARR